MERSNEEGSQQRPPVRVTYAGRRTIARGPSPRDSYPQPPPSAVRWETSETPHESRETTPADLPDIVQLFRIAKEKTEQQKADRQAALNRKREAAQKAARERKQQATTLPDDEVVARLGAATEKYGECGICWGRITTTPYTLVCGHSFCGPCLKTTFEGLLLNSISQIRHRRHLNCNHDANACRFVPKNACERDKLAQCLTLHGRRPEEVFTYPCPMCRSHIAVAPAPNVMLQSVFGALNAGLQSFEEQADPSIDTSIPSSTSFAGCFLGQDV